MSEEINTEESERTKRERTLFGFLHFPKYPMVHVLLLLLSAVFSINAQIYYQVDWSIPLDKNDQALSITVIPSLILILFAIFLYKKKKFRESMDLTRKVLTQKNLEVTPEKLEMIVDRFNQTGIGFFMQIANVIFIVSLYFVLQQTALMLMFKILL